MNNLYATFVKTNIISALLLFAAESCRTDKSLQKLDTSVFISSCNLLHNFFVIFSVKLTRNKLKFMVVLLLNMVKIYPPSSRKKFSISAPDKGVIKF